MNEQAERFAKHIVTVGALLAATLTCALTGRDQLAAMAMGALTMYLVPVAVPTVPRAAAVIAGVLAMFIAGAALSGCAEGQAAAPVACDIIHKLCTISNTACGVITSGSEVTQ